MIIEVVRRRSQINARDVEWFRNERQQPFPAVFPYSATQVTAMGVEVVAMDENRKKSVIVSENVGGCNCAKSTVNSVMLVLKPANFLPAPTRLARRDCLCKLEAAPVLSFSIRPLGGDDRR